VYPFERFTEGAKQALTLAQEEAERSHHSYIGTEHLLLGLMRREEGLAAKALTSLGIGIGAVRSSIQSLLGENERIIIQQIIPTSRVKTVIEIAFREARSRGDGAVGTEHLLVGLLIEGEGIAAHVLEKLGATLEKVSGEIDRLHLEIGAESAAGEEEGGRQATKGTFGHSVTSVFRPSRPGERFGTGSPSSPDELGRAAERLAAEQHTVVGPEHLLLAALETDPPLDTDPLVGRMLAALGIDEEKIAELRRIATPPDSLVELRRTVHTKALELGDLRDLPRGSTLALLSDELRARLHAPSDAERKELRRLRAELDEAERRWRSGEDEAPGGGPGSGDAAP
jgi:ATP-dependent Clp protease ATP-binding subunit ClpA